MTLGDYDAITMIAVKNLAAAKRFYCDALGFEPYGPEHPTVATLKTGRTAVNLYESEFAGTNKATTALWVAGAAFGDVVAGLRAKGVTFEHYDLPQGSRDGDVHYFGDLRVVWFRDPDGNILSVQNQ